VRIRGFDHDLTARLLVTHVLGNEWRDTSTIRQDLGFVVSTDGAFSTVIPMYEPLNPIDVALLAEDGTSLAETSILLRATRHLDPFPLVYGALPHSLDEEETPVTAAELPSEWWAYDAVHSLWISEPPPQEAWPAIAQWVLAGGSLVIASGPDYFRFDSPALRQLLPLSNPSLTTHEDGTLALTGTMKPGTSRPVSRGDLPLVFGWPYGAGHVAVVAVRPTDLTGAEFERAREAVPGATRLSMTAVSEALLGSLPVDRPTHGSALLLIALTTIALGAVVFVGRRHRWAGVATAAVVFAALCVWSGFYANNTKQVSSIYVSNTVLHLATSFGIDHVSSSFYSTETDPLPYALGGEAIPLQAPSGTVTPHPMPRPTATPRAYAHTAEPGRVIASAAEIGQKTFYAYATAPSLVRLSVDRASGHAVLDYRADVELVDCWLIADGQGVRVPPVSNGTHTYEQASSATLGSLVREADGTASLVLQHLIEELPFQTGMWFVGLSVPRDDVATEAGRKVRHLDVYVVRGEVS